MNLKRDSNYNLSRRSSFVANSTRDPKDEQIKKLQHQLAQATSKNETRPAQPNPPPNGTNKEVKTKEAIDFITQTMKALEAFKEQLTK